MSQRWLAPVGAQPIAAGAAYASSVTRTAVTPLPAPVVGANGASDGWELGKILRVRAFGTFSNTGTPTLVLGVALAGAAGTILGETTTITTITAATNWMWYLEFSAVCRSLGATGTVMPAGRVYMPASLTQYQAPYMLPATAMATVTVDTTVAKSVDIVATWGTNSASNTLTCHGISAVIEG